MSLSEDIILHHARLFGLQAEAGRCDGDIRIGEVTLRTMSSAMPRNAAHRSGNGRQSLHAVAARDMAWGRLRSFHTVQSIEGVDVTPVVVDSDGRTIWGWVPDAGGVLHIGTDLAADLTLIRQGDPAAVANRPTEAQWGIAGERPNYLFEGQLEADRPQERLADWWMWTLRDALCRLGGIKASDMLPFGAPGAVVITGDDDQAPMDDYRSQAGMLGTLPVTYFLHPLTKHDAASLVDHAKGRALEWELHPDALDTPDEYADRLREQCQWFTELTGTRPRLLRNHGFLNDGYWGHAGPWIGEGIIGSSNIPGVDGRVVNGSLLPARLALGNAVTPHWSLLTTFGDGVFFVYDWSEEQALAAVRVMAEQIIASNVPGLIVLNLHPANYKKAAAMHEAAHRLVGEMGFAAMNLGHAISWFSQLDAGIGAVSMPGMVAPGSLTRYATAVEAASASSDALPRPVGMVRRVINAVVRHGRRSDAP